MADPAAVGTRGEPFRMDIERGKIREFAVATGATPAHDPAYLDAENPVIEPTFLTTAFFWQAGAADPWPAVAIGSTAWPARGAGVRILPTAPGAGERSPAHPRSPTSTPNRAGAAENSPSR